MQDPTDPVAAEATEHANKMAVKHSPSLSGSKLFFPNLDALRFIAFSLVFLQHGFYGAFQVFHGRSSLLDSVLSCIFLGGGTGVQIFFVLSGFLITYLIILEIKREGKLNVGKFYMRRTLRIWPLYYATVLFAFVLYPWLKGFMGISSGLCSQPAYYYTFLANFDLIRVARECPGKDAMSQAIVWSVGIEEQFYLMWPLLFLIFRRMQPIIFILVLAICLAFRISKMHDPGTALYYHTFSVMGDLAIGGLGAYLSINSRRFLHFWETLPKAVIGTVYIVLVAVYFFRPQIIQSGGAIVVERWMFDLFWIFIILEQNFSKNSPFKLKRLKFFSRWGKYTYGLYMLHPIAILIVDIVPRLLHIKVISFSSLLVAGWVSLALSLLLAKASYHWLERPFLKIKERFAVIRTKTT